MSGGGHVIIQNATVNTLSDPLVSGALPDWMRLAVSAILAKDPEDWTYQERCVLGHAYSWALCNL
jgi:hypothetical protein